MLIFGTLGSLAILHNHSELETARLDRIRQRASSSTKKLILSLQTTMNDWGQWDEAYDFLVDGDDQWAVDNITADNLAGLNIDAMAIFDTNLNCRFGVMMKEDSPQYQEGAGEAFCRQIIPYLSRQGAAVDLSNHIVLMPDRDALIAVMAPIIRTNGSGPVIGYFVGASFLSNSLQSDIGNNELPVSMLRADHPADNDEYELAEQTIAGKSKGLYVVSSRMSILYLRFTDDGHDDGLILRLEYSRDENRAGLRDVTALLASLLAILLMQGVIGRSSMRRYLLRPIRALTRAVQGVTSGNVKADDIEVTGADELGQLSGAVRTMVTKLEESRHEAEGLAYDLQKFRFAVENATDMIVIADADFSIVYASRSTAAVSGYANAELTGKGALQFWSYQDESQRDAIRQELEAGRPWHGETQCRKKNGDRYVTDLNVAPVIDKRGQLVFAISIQRDVTQAKEVDRMKSEFVSIASHQLKTPLTGIKWFTETLMQDDSGFTAEQKEFMHQLYEMNERMIRLVSDLLNVSRIETGRKFSITKALGDLEPVIRQAVAEQSVLASKRGVRITVDVPPQTLVLMDREKILQTMHNLINNAVKYSRDGGEVRIKVAMTTSSVTLTVADDGIGVPEAQQKRMFEKFFRADNVASREGTGLGLYIVRAIIEGHGGTITMTSKENVGTTFTINLPRQEAV